LRRVRRPDVLADEPQICAVVDHPKLEHQWLWDIFGSKVRKDVKIEELFDETEDLPPPPPKQELVKPEFVIDVPDPVVGPDDEEFEIDGIEDTPEPLEKTPPSALWWARIFSMESSTSSRKQAEACGCR